MKETSYYFNYEPKNLDLVNIDVISGNFDMSILIIAGVVFLVGAIIYLIMPKIIGFIIILGEEKQKEANKNRIKELILMKEIQGEIEKDIDEALLNVGLKANT